ncbi:hypothetical protein [Streptomyces abikoensis]|uniref:Uncharacterized protein n=1 Tax=Streptomyces abikoensis TaxID=97398 RepID=A0ABW7TCP4_9ACTN
MAIHRAVADPGYRVRAAMARAALAAEDGAGRVVEIVDALAP